MPKVLCRCLSVLAKVYSNKRLIWLKGFSVKMIRLTRVGWNNVIIFGVIAFILLINLTHDNTFNTVKALRNEEVNILGEAPVILTLTVNERWKVERIGRSWRTNNEWLKGQALDQMMLAWHETEATVIVAPSDFDPQLALAVTVELAGVERPLLINLYVEQDALNIHNTYQNQWTSVPMQRFDQLIPAELLN